MENLTGEDLVPDAPSETRPRPTKKRRIVMFLSFAAGCCALLAAILVPMAQEARRAAVRSTDR